MFTKTDFKSTKTHKIYTLELILNNKTSNIYTNIEHKLLDLLELSHNDYKIILYTITNEKVEENNETCFANYCGSTEYPAFYFKPILYTDLVSNLQPIDTSNLIQQEGSDSDSDSIPDLISDEDSDDEYIDSINNNLLLQ